MNMQMPFTFSSDYSLGVWRSLGLRLLVVAIALGKLLVFLASRDPLQNLVSEISSQPDQWLTSDGWLKIVVLQTFPSPCFTREGSSSFCSSWPLLSHLF